MQIQLPQLIGLLQKAHFVTLVTTSGEIPIRLCLGDQYGYWGVQMNVRIPFFIHIVGAYDTGQPILMDIPLGPIALEGNTVTMADIQFRLYTATPLALSNNGI